MKKVLFLVVLAGGICSAFVNGVQPTDAESTTNATVNESRKSSDGIKFQTMSFKEAKAAAKEQGKIIFIDSYTSWCGPCKLMAKNEFVNTDLGKLYNSKFINLKIDIEKDADGAEIARLYKIRAYPTLLYVDGDGKLVKTLVGYQYANDLIAIGKSL